MGPYTLLNLLNVKRIAQEIKFSIKMNETKCEPKKSRMTKRTSVDKCCERFHGKKKGRVTESDGNVPH